MPAISSTSHRGKNRFKKVAIDLSIEGIKKGSASFGAVIVKEGKVIGKGYNTTMLSYDPTFKSVLLT